MIPLYKMQGKKFREQKSNSMVTQAAKKAGSRDPYGHWRSGLLVTLKAVRMVMVTLWLQLLRLSPTLPLYTPVIWHCTRTTPLTLGTLYLEHASLSL